MYQSFQGIVFDLDGTLVDSEIVHADAWLGVLARHGLVFDYHWFDRWVGLSDRHLAESVASDYALAVTTEVLRKEKQQLFHTLVARQLKAFSGVEEELAGLSRSGIPMALATNSPLADVEQVFRATRLGQWLQQVVTADDVRQLKPAPDMYLLAVERLGLLPAHCIAMEDSPAGVAAARKAGLYVLGLTTSQPAGVLAEAHEIFPRPYEALQRIKSLLAGAPR